MKQSPETDRMKRYEYYSDLPPEQIRARLTVRARAMKSVWDQYDEHTLFVKFLPDGRFYLMKTGGMMQVRPQLPFVGRATPWGEGSLIAGDFEPPESAKYQVLVAVLVVFLLGAAVTRQFVSSLLGALLAGGMFCGLIWGLAPSISRSEQRETIEFIERQLLKE